MPGPDSIRSLVVTGDSFTEGLEDDLGPTGRHLGWADRVAAALAARSGRVRYINLAVRGRLTDQVVDEQLPIALSRCSETWQPSTPAPTTCCGHAPMSPPYCAAMTAPSSP